MPGRRNSENVASYQYDEKFTVTKDIHDVFATDGAILVKNLFGKDEMQHIQNALKENPKVNAGIFQEQTDDAGRVVRLLIWNQPGNDVTGMVGRCEKMVNTAEKLLGGEVYHYHSKLIMKEPRTGGTFHWHQDYGYWYQNGLLTPDMLTCFVAVDKCVKENGCLEVALGTHRCGRLDHRMTPPVEFLMIDPTRVQEVLKQFPKTHVEMDPGDCLFFHSNLLHTSNANNSEDRRWTFAIAYNRADNDPIYKHHHASYTPLEKVPNSALLECNNFTDLSGKDFMDPSWKPEN